MSAMWAKAFSRWCPWNFISLKRIHQFQKNQISNQRCASASCDISTLSSEQTKITTTSKRITIIQKQYTKCLHYLTLPSHLHSKRRTLKNTIQLITHAHHSQAPLDIPSDDNWCYSWWKVSAHLRFIRAHLGTTNPRFSIWNFMGSTNRITQNDLRLQINLSCSKTVGTFYSSFPMNKVVLQPSNVNKLRLLMKIMLCREVLIPLDPQVDSNSNLHI